MNAVPSERSARSPWFWAGMIFTAFGVIAALMLTGAVNHATGYILLVIAALLAVPLTRAGMARQKRMGSLTPAVTRYTRRFMIASFGYVLGLGVAVSLHERLQLTGAGAFAIALLPVLPIFGMIWTMARYLVEEEDEYLRHRAAMASLAGLGLLLALGSFWGFLETFGVAPHVEAWWTFPVWALGMGAAQCWMAFRDRTGGE